MQIKNKSNETDAKLLTYQAQGSSATIHTDKQFSVGSMQFNVHSGVSPFDSNGIYSQVRIHRITTFKSTWIRQAMD